MSDLIRRDDVIATVYNQSDDEGLWSITAKEMENIINSLPSVEPDVPDIRVGKWIPCSKSLPEERQWVLCQCRAKKMEVLRINSDHDWEQLYPRRTYMGSFVLAWMPLPEPYKESSND